MFVEENIFFGDFECAEGVGSSARMDVCMKASPMLDDRPQGYGGLRGVSCLVVDSALR